MSIKHRFAAGAAVAGGSEKRIWMGAALGFGFGALGGAVSSWLPVIPGGSTSAGLANAMIEIGENGIVGGLSGGTSAALSNGKFEDGFRSGLIMGAALASLKIAILGVRYDPSSIKEDFHSETAKSFSAQNSDDHSYLSGSVAKAGMPEPSSVEFRRGGLFSLLSGRSFTLGASVSTSDDTMNELRNGSVTTLAHELRHIAQERSASLGMLEFIAVWLFQEITSDQQYQVGNTTLEPHYQE